MPVRIWLASIADVDPAPGLDLLAADELARADRIGSPDLRRRLLVRRWMARDLLGRETGEDPGRMVLRKRCKRCGELHPASPLRAGSRKVWWSASSSAGLAALAIADRRVGLDVEEARERRRQESIARRHFSEDEWRAVTEAPARFLEFWTLKEAYLKALGLGLPGGLRSLDCTDLVPADGGWSASPAHPGWRFQNLQPEPGFVAALATEGGADSIELRRWEPDAGGAG